MWSEERRGGQRSDGPRGHWVELAFTESELKFCVKEHKNICNSTPSVFSYDFKI